MSDPRQNKFEGFCRLCTSVESNNIHIFGDEGEGRQLASKIRICLPIFVHREDTLPKVVCLPCVTKLESFYNFREACVKAEGTLEAFLKEEQNFPHEPEVCLEEGTCAKPPGEDNCNIREKCDVRAKEEKGKGKRRKKFEDSENGNKGLHRGKRHKKVTGQKDLSSVQVAEVNGNNVVDEAKDIPPLCETVSSETEPIQGLPNPLAEVNGNNVVDGPRDIPPLCEREPSEAEPMEELPISLSPTTNLTHVLFPQLGDLHPEDYLLIKEEKFLAGASWNIENLFPPSHEGGLSFIKQELSNNLVTEVGSCMVPEGVPDDHTLRIKQEVDPTNIIMGQTRQFLPPVWDIFEKVVHESRNEGQDTAVVTHRRYIVGKRAFPCALCGNCFLLSGAGNLTENGWSGSRSRNLTSNSSGNNKQMRDTNERPYGCLRCGKRYFRRSDLVRHEKTHLEARPFVCRLCGKGFCRKEHAQRHMSLHVGEKPFRCDICLKLFTRKEHLARHKRCHHHNNYQSNSNQEGMTVKIEEGMEGVNCQMEDMAKEVVDANRETAVSGNASRLHLMNSSVKVAQQKVQRDNAEAAKAAVKKPYQCEICIRAFSRREHLVRHRRSHFKEQLKAASLTMSATKQTAQEEDDEDTIEPLSLADTVIDDLEDSGKSGHSCRFCTQTFSCKEELDRHRSRMHPLAEAVSAMVPQLKSDEVHSDDYRSQTQTVTNSPSGTSPSPPHLTSEHFTVELIDEVPATKQSYCCILCPQIFSRKENVERHLKSVHAGLKPYACNTCGKRFGRAEQCRRHEKRHQRHHQPGKTSMDGDDISTPVEPVHVMSGIGENSTIGQVSAPEPKQSQATKESSDLGISGVERLGNSSRNTVSENQVKGDVLCNKEIVSKKKKVKHHQKLKGAMKNELPKQQSHRSKKNKSYPCQECDSVFTKKKHLARHKAVHDEAVVC